MHNNQFQNIMSGSSFRYPTLPPRPNPSVCAVNFINTNIWDIWIRNKSIAANLAPPAVNLPSQFTLMNSMISTPQELSRALDAITDEDLQQNIEIIFCRKEIYQAANLGLGSWLDYSSVPNPSLNTWKEVCGGLLLEKMNGYRNTYAVKIEKFSNNHYAISYYWIGA